MKELKHNIILRIEVDRNTPDIVKIKGSKYSQLLFSNVQKNFPNLIIATNFQKTSEK